MIILIMLDLEFRTPSLSDGRGRLSVEQAPSNWKRGTTKQQHLMISIISISIAMIDYNKCMVKVNSLLLA